MEGEPSVVVGAGTFSSSREQLCSRQNSQKDAIILTDSQTQKHLAAGGLKKVTVGETTTAEGAAGGRRSGRRQGQMVESARRRIKNAEIKKMSFCPCFSCCRKQRSAMQFRTVIPNHMFTADHPSQHPNKRYKGNKIRTTKYSILSFLPKNLFEQFHRFANLYFIFIVVLNWVPAIEVFGRELSAIPVIFVLSITALKDAFEDFRRYKSDKKINSITCRVWNNVEKRYVKTLWQDLIVGDFVHLSCNETIPADILLLRSADSLGICYVETSNLDGESNLKQRQVVSSLQKVQDTRRKTGSTVEETFKPLDFTSTIECEQPNNQIYKFNGFLLHQNGTREAINKNNLLLRGCEIRNTDFIEGIVVYAGHETKAMKNNNGPRYKRSELERLMNWDVVWCVVILLILCLVGAIGSGIWLGSYADPYEVAFLTFTREEKELKPELEGFINFWSYIVILQVMIPISLYVSIELIKLGQIFFITQDKELYHEESDRRIHCRALNITEELGQIKYVMSDKTGTLTENQMVFRRCAVAGIDYGPSMVNCQEEQKDFATPTGCKEHVEYVKDVTPNPVLAELVKSLTEDISNKNMPIGLGGDYVDRELFLNYLTPLFRMETETISVHDSVAPAGTVSADATPRLGRSKKRGLGKSLLNLPQKMRFRNKKSDARRSRSKGTLNPIYEAESPDELSLVYAANAYGFRLLKRQVNYALVELPDGNRTRYELLHVLPFDADRKRMSVIVKTPFSNNPVLFCKGADSAIIQLLSEKFTSSDRGQNYIFKSMEYLNLYASYGLRTLCLAKRELTEDEYYYWAEQHREAEIALEDREELIYQSALRIEQDLELLGVTGIEDRLQDGVPETIAALRHAGIRVWVLTGDKIETAVNIAYACRLFSYGMEIIQICAKNEADTKEMIEHHLEAITGGENSIAASSEDENLLIERRRKKRIALVIDGMTLSYCLNPSPDEKFIELVSRCTSVLCCRATPLQKSNMVRVVKEKLECKTLAIGDGANDVSMIQSADVGIGINGQEGMQAVMASDFALPRFRFLKRLLLVHGHWCYDRLARIVLFFFYKNALFVFTLFWFQLFCGFSSQNVIDPLYLQLYNLIFTSLPPLLFAVFEQSAPDHLLMDQPKLYGVGREGLLYKPYSFWINMADALWQSSVVFYVAYLMYQDTDTGLWSFGFLVFSSIVMCNQAHLALEVKSWTAPLVVSILLSIAVYFCFALIYNAVVTPDIEVDNPPFWVAETMMVKPVYWLALAFTVFLAMLPRATVKIVSNSLLPPDIILARLRLREKEKASAKKSHQASKWSVWWSKKRQKVSIVSDRSSANVCRSAEPDTLHANPEVQSDHEIAVC